MKWDGFSHVTFPVRYTVTSNPHVRIDLAFDRAKNGAIVLSEFHLVQTGPEYFYLTQRFIASAFGRTGVVQQYQDVVGRMFRPKPQDEVI